MANLLTAAQLKQFREQGYAVAEDVFDPESDFAALKRDYSDILDGVAASMLNCGTIQSYARHDPFSERLINLVEQAGDLPMQPFDISLPQRPITADTPMYLGAAAFNLLTHPSLIDLVEQLIGPEVYSNPVQHIRMKVPTLQHQDADAREVGRTTPWHQDNGVVTEEADGSEILTVWVPVTDASVESGCLHIVPGAHKRGMVNHCPGFSSPDRGSPGLRIPDELVPEHAAIPVPLRAGSALFLTRHTMHCSGVNTTDTIRWSFDLRYQPPGQPTGRSEFPGFVVRSKSDPSSVLADHREWANLWDRARAQMLKADPTTLRFNRWNAGAPWCA